MYISCYTGLMFQRNIITNMAPVIIKLQNLIYDNICTGYNRK